MRKGQTECRNRRTKSHLNQPPPPTLILYDQSVTTLPNLKHDAQGRIWHICLERWKVFLRLLEGIRFGSSEWRKWRIWRIWRGRGIWHEQIPEIPCHPFAKHMGHHDATLQRSTPPVEAGKQHGDGARNLVICGNPTVGCSKNLCKEL